MIAIIDYRLGNLRSVAGAVKKLGFEPTITNEREMLMEARKLILPGVGAFGDGMRNLRELGLVQTLNFLVLERKIPILGICLGSQLMAKNSEEFGFHEGLGWIDAEVKKLDVKEFRLRVPHVGWDDLLKVSRSVLFDDIPDDALFYYVHSYHMQCADRKVVIGECEYGRRFVAAFHQDNIYATQFHPEKSQLHGLRLLKNFLEKG